MENRRTFIKKTAIGTAGVSVGLTAMSAKSYGRILWRQRPDQSWELLASGDAARNLMEGFSLMYGEGVYIKTVCDVDMQYHESFPETGG